MDSSATLNFNCMESDQFEKFLAFLTSVPQVQSYMKLNQFSSNLQSVGSKSLQIDLDPSSECMSNASSLNCLENVHKKYLINQTDSKIQTTPIYKTEQSFSSPTKTHAPTKRHPNQTRILYDKDFEFDPSFDSSSSCSVASANQIAIARADDLIRPGAINTKSQKRKLTNFKMINPPSMTQQTLPLISLGGPALNNSGQLGNDNSDLKWPKLGVPLTASPTRYSAPVHIDVGGTLYTSSLKVLTKYPDSRLGKMFNGSIPIVLDVMKQHYFIDRDGKLFRHILNFLRTGTIYLDSNFKEFDQLTEEVSFYGLTEMQSQLEKMPKSNQHDCDNSPISNDVHLSNKIGRVGDFEIKNTLVPNPNDHDCHHHHHHHHQKSPQSSTKHKHLDLLIDNLKLRNLNLQSTCIWFELDSHDPWSGLISYTVKSHPETIPMPMQTMNNYLLNNCSAVHEVDQLSGTSMMTHEFKWVALKRFHILNLWELFLNLKFEILTKFEIVTEEKTTRFVHILKCPMV